MEKQKLALLVLLNLMCLPPLIWSLQQHPRSFLFLFAHFVFPALQHLSPLPADHFVLLDAAPVQKLHDQPEHLKNHILQLK